jgi:hypothetical protein
MSTMWIGELLDRAGAAMLVLEQEGVFPGELRVSLAAHEAFSDLRRRELSDGVPLLVLGTSVVADPAIAAEEFALTP